MPNFVEIGQTATQMMIIFIHRNTVIFRFLIGGRRHLGFTKFQPFNDQMAEDVELRRRAKFGRHRSTRCGDMMIFRFFQDGAVRHLGFLNFWNFNWTLKRAKLRHHVKFRRNRSIRGQNMAIFVVSMTAVAAILDFQSFKFSKVVGFKSVELRRRPKFGRNRSSRCIDMTIFRFFCKMAAVRHLGFVVWVIGPPTKGVWWSLSLCKIW